MATRQIDHIVMPTASLVVARDRLAALGFTVAPVGVHPFGTENVCVYLGDGSFIESLAVGDADAVMRAVEAGNVFVSHDDTYRARNGDEGFSALVFSTGDAEADHARFVAENLSAGDLLVFSRGVTDSSGKSDTATFKLAFAGTAAAPDVSMFTCQRINQPKVDRAALQRHDNGVTGLATVVLSADEPIELASLLGTVAETSVEALGSSGRQAIMPNGAVAILDADETERMFGIRPHLSGPSLAAARFAVADLAATAATLRRNGVAHHMVGQRLVAPPAPGQGAIFAFEERA